MKKANTKATQPPGDFGIWLIVYIELITFGFLFIGFAFARRAEIELFNESQLLLSQTSGFINTIILLTSSYFVVKSIESIQNFKQAKASLYASRYLLGAMFLGLLFMSIKFIELADKYEHGINLSTNTFFMFYIILSVFHFMHVMLGMVILYSIYKKTKENGYTADSHEGMESGAIYWHLVDLLWIVLFPLIYIIR